jgi:hypothetical protein
VRAIFAANATTATLGWTRARSARSQTPVAVLLLANEGMADRAPWMSILRRYLLPRFVIPKSLFGKSGMSVSADEDTGHGDMDHGG